MASSVVLNLNVNGQILVAIGTDGADGTGPTLGALRFFAAKETNQDTA